jgi:mRNA interferase MazF
MIRRGDIVLVQLPFTDIPGNKVRPALVIQNDHDNQRLRKTVVAVITSNLRRLNDPSHLLINPAHPDGASSGLSAPSLVSCNNLSTVEQAHVVRTMGHRSVILLARLDGCLRSALEIA